MTLGTLIIGLALTGMVSLLVLCAVHIFRQDKRIADREGRIEKLRCELACADASFQRLNDKIADLEAAARVQIAEDVIPFYPQNQKTNIAG